MWQPAEVIIYYDETRSAQLQGTKTAIDRASGRFRKNAALPNSFLHVCRRCINSGRADPHHTHCTLPPSCGLVAAASDLASRVGRPRPRICMMRDESSAPGMYDTPLDLFRVKNSSWYILPTICRLLERILLLYWICVLFKWPGVAWSPVDFEKYSKNTTLLLCAVRVA
jgi:hypothetical protein